jgi:hypothetical protein
MRFRINRENIRRNVYQHKKLALIITAAVLIAAFAAVILVAHNHRRHSVHSNIITTVFWVGEASDSDNGFIPNAASAWDGQWQAHYGGIDNPDKRNGYQPADFTPKENPFYFALPYNDLDIKGKRKLTYTGCFPWQPAPTNNHSVCKNIWIAITRNGRVAYAQWEDVGPFEEDDSTYVFGTASPTNIQGEKAGLDVSPSVRDYLKLQDVDRTDWHFVLPRDVPNGPWKQTVTTSKGYTL